jgi:hypothetical protein
MVMRIIWATYLTSSFPPKFSLYFVLKYYSFTEDGSTINVPETIRQRPKKYGGNEGN